MPTELAIGLGVTAFSLLMGEYFTYLIDIPHLYIYNHAFSITIYGKQKE